MTPFQASEAQIREFQRDGYLFCRGLFDHEEMSLLLNLAKADREMKQEASHLKQPGVRPKEKLIAVRDTNGAETKLWLSDDLEEGVYSAVVRCRRIADTMEKLLGDEVYHYHHKMMLKEPRVGGAWEWHQDYGYWYNMGCLYPDMASCMLAVDRATRANGCLQVLRGSHLLGRVNHGTFGTQTGADPERVEAALSKMELVYCEMEPGDALFFHANLLHRSDANTSPDPRWSLICCYNTRHNNPYKKEGGHSSYAPLEKWPDEKVLEVAKAQWAQMKATV
jgi:ectoine hydroxylase-related dioxygenase (phytanoyl-CoA dioxygenase family)